MVSRSPHRPDADGLTATLVAFDVLAVAGADLRAAPWHERRAQLEALLDGATGAVRLTPVLDASPALHAALVADGWEGTVAKRTSGRYRCGHRSTSWVKLKSPAARDRDRRRVLAASTCGARERDMSTTLQRSGEGPHAVGALHARAAPSSTSSMRRDVAHPSAGSSRRSLAGRDDERRRRRARVVRRCGRAADGEQVIAAPTSLSTADDRGPTITAIVGGLRTR